MFIWIIRLLLGGYLLFLLFCAVTSLRHIPFSYTLGNLKARLFATLMSIVGIGVVIAAIMSSQDSKGWLIGLVVSVVSIVLSAVLWSSRRL